MSRRSKNSSVFAEHDISFVDIIRTKKLGGSKALKDYLQMRSSQLVRLMRRVNGDQAEVARIRKALMAMSEASRLIDKVTGPAPAQSASTRKSGASAK